MDEDITAEGDGPVDGEDTAEAESIRLLMAIRRLGVTDTRVLAAVERVPRAAFIQDVFARQASLDRPLPIECGQTISQPSLVALMTQALDVQPHHKVLEIGTGSGYQAAVLSQLARRVYTVERHRALSRSAEDRLNQLGFHNVVTRPGDGFRGWPELAPFDRIMVTAAAPEVPDTLIDQLAVGGIMVVPVGPASGDQTLCRVVRTETDVTVEDLGSVLFVPMLGGMAEEE
ncbi:MAG: protein-L-isoaspartate(D-aspartate) O-methyltransferase [Alphaproteobacteria bacterium]